MSLTREMLEQMGLSAAQIGQIEAEQRANLERIEALTTEGASQRERIETLTAEGVSQRERIEALTAEGASQRERIEALTTEGVSQQERIETLTAEGVSQRERIEALTAEGSSCRERLDALSQEYGAYRAGVERRARAEAFERALREARIHPRFLPMIRRATDLDSLDLSDPAAAAEALRRDWPDCVARSALRPLGVDTPPAAEGPRRLSADEIMAIRDDDRRVREIARNHDLFGF